MKNFAILTAIYLLFNFIILFSACGNQLENQVSDAPPDPPVNANKQTFIPANLNEQNTNAATPPPNLQSEILDERNAATASPLGRFDFKNFSYPLPRGWQDADAKEIKLENGSRPMTGEKIGLSYVTTKYGDATGDGQDEAFVILKINTAGSAIPQVVYVYTWKDEQPALIWHFRTGDRADGGLKDLRAEAGELVIEIFGQDRYIFGEGETMKITGDEEQICCPTHYTRTRYKWNGSDFLMQGKRLTFSVSDRGAQPVENKGEIIEREKKSKK